MSDHADNAPARRGKIASLPAALREELCRRMHDGGRGPQLLPWLNAEPAVLAVLDAHFGEEPITAQNLSEWRKGGYQDWLRKRERIVERKLLSEHCLMLAEAGGASGVALAVAGGEIMAAMEDFDAQTLKLMLSEKPEKLLELAKALAALETARAKTLQGEASAATVKQRDRALEQRDRVLGMADRKLVMTEEQHRRKMADGFIDFAEDAEARRIALDTSLPRTVRVDVLMRRMFGERPAGVGGPAPASLPEESAGVGGAS